MRTMERSCWAAVSRAAFSRIDLLVTIFTLAFLTLMLLPALAKTHVKPQGTQCLYNLRQIMVAWQMYADDSNGKLAPNHGAFPANPDYNAASGAAYIARWVNGSMRNSSAVGPPYTIDDANNSQLLVDATYSALGNYIKNPVVYRCPSDLSTWTMSGATGSQASLNGTEQPRVRTYSMNAGVGCAYNGTRQDPGHAILGHWLAGAGATSPGPWQTYIKNSDIYGPLNAANLFVCLEEHPDSINDAAFAVYMPVNPVDSSARWIDVPAATHSGKSCNFSFADGHVELHKWINPSLIPSAIWAADNTVGYGNGSLAPSGPAPDIYWVAKHTSCQPTGWPGY